MFHAFLMFGYSELNLRFKFYKSAFDNRKRRDVTLNLRQS